MTQFHIRLIYNPDTSLWEFTWGDKVEYVDSATCQRDIEAVLASPVPPLDSVADVIFCGVRIEGIPAVQFARFQDYCSMFVGNPYFTEKLS